MNQIVNRREGVVAEWVEILLKKSRGKRDADKIRKTNRKMQ